MVFRALGMPAYPAFLMLSSAHNLFDQDGKLIDEATAKRAATFVSGFVEFAGGFVRKT